MTLIDFKYSRRNLIPSMRQFICNKHLISTAKHQMSHDLGTLTINTKYKRPKTINAPGIGIGFKTMLLMMSQ